MKKPLILPKDAETPQAENEETKRPKNLPALSLPSEGYVLEIDGKFKTQYGTEQEALKAGTALKRKFQAIMVNVYDVKQHTRTRIETPD